MTYRPTLFVALIAMVCVAALIYVDKGIAANSMENQNRVIRPTPANWSALGLTISNLGHATLLMNVFGTSIITDPAFYDKVGLSVDGLFTVGPRRFIPCALGPSELPPIDIILITHPHMDHLDVPSLKMLPKSSIVVGCRDCAELIKPLGFQDVRALSWGDETTVGDLKISALGARHWGRRWPWDIDRGYNSYILEKHGTRFLVACDSAFTDVFAPLAQRHLNAAAFSIGAYDPWITSHANPEQVWKMFQQSGARYLIPIHWGTFRLSKEPMDEPMQRLITAAGPDEKRIVLRQIGATWQLPAESETAAAR